MDKHKAGAQCFTYTISSFLDASVELPIIFWDFMEHERSVLTKRNVCLMSHNILFNFNLLACLTVHFI